MTDDQTAASLRYMPNVNRLLTREGTLFENSVASFPLCCPSRSTHLTGQYAHNHQVLHNAGPFGGSRRLDHANTLPVWLQAAGYRTMHVGRYLNGYEYSDGVPPGWSDWHGAPHSHAFNYTSWRVNENGSLVSHPDAAHPGEYETDFFGRRAGELIEQASPGDRPFYLQLWFVAPHRGSPRDPDDPAAVGTPSPEAEPPRPVRRRAASRAPRASTRPASATSPRWSPTARASTPRPRPRSRRTGARSSRASSPSTRRCARVVDTLARTGELANTLVVFTSDNGFMHGEHRAKAEKVLPYEESVRVPLVMRGPGIPRHWRDPGPVANIDVVPTIVDATGATAAAQARRPLPVPAAGRPRRLVGARHPARERQRRQQRPALPRHPHHALRLRRAPDHRRDRALRPRARSLRAEQPRGRRRATTPFAATSRDRLKTPQALRRPRLPEAAGAAAAGQLERAPAARRRLPALRPRPAHRRARPPAASAPRSPSSAAGGWPARRASPTPSTSAGRACARAALPAARPRRPARRPPAHARPAPARLRQPLSRAPGAGTRSRTCARGRAGRAPPGSDPTPG